MICTEYTNEDNTAMTVEITREVDRVPAEQMLTEAGWVITWIGEMNATAIRAER